MTTHAAAAQDVIESLTVQVNSLGELPSHPLNHLSSLSGHLNSWLEDGLSAVNRAKSNGAGGNAARGRADASSRSQPRAMQEWMECGGPPGRAGYVVPTREWEQDGVRSSENDRQHSVPPLPPSLPSGNPHLIIGKPTPAPWRQLPSADGAISTASTVSRRNSQDDRRGSQVCKQSTLTILQRNLF
jgi:hypothetical protein